MNQELALSEIRPTKEAIEDELLQRDGVVGVDIGYKEVGGRRTNELAIRVLVVEKRDVPAKERIPAMIEDVRTDVIQRGRFTFDAGEVDWPCDTMAGDTTRHDPLVGGCSIGTCGAGLGSGTLATFVRDIPTDDIMILSCWHVLVAGDSRNLPVAQPSPDDNGVCPNDVIGHVDRSQINDYVDCAVAFWNGVRPIVDERFIKDIGLIGPPLRAQIGYRVRKSGRTSGVTYGDVDTVDLTYWLHSAGVNRIFRRQIGVWRTPGMNETFSCPGDSGSLVLNNTRPVGMHIGGSKYNPFFPDGAYAVVTPIHAILQAMNVRINVPKDKEKEKEKEKETEKVKDGAIEKISIESQLLNVSLDPADAATQFYAQPQGPLEARLARLEATVDELQHFIRHVDRPDLSMAPPDERPDPSSAPHSDDKRD